MHPTSIEWMLIGVGTIQTLSAAVSALDKPVQPGLYSWFYKFSRQFTNTLIADMEQKYNVALPSITDAPTPLPAKSADQNPTQGNTP